MRYKGSSIFCPFKRQKKEKNQTKNKEETAVYQEESIICICNECLAIYSN